MIVVALHFKHIFDAIMFEQVGHLLNSIVTKLSIFYYYDDTI